MKMEGARRGMRSSGTTARYRTAVLAVALVVLLCATAVSSVSVVGYKEKDEIPLKANSYRSRRTLSPVGYYQLPVCSPEKDKIKDAREHPLIGEILTGNRLVLTQYKIQVGVNVQCASLCTTTFSPKEVRRANYMIENAYYTRMFLDNNPVVSAAGTNEYRRGFPLGEVPADKAAEKKPHPLNNHLEFTIRIRDAKMAGVTGEEIVGISVVAKSVKSTSTCTDVAYTASEEKFLLPTTAERKSVHVSYTYSVKWERSNDVYPIEHSVAEKTQRHGHKIAALYGVLLTLLAGVVVGFVLLRTVRKDLAVYLDEELEESETREESGWKLVRGDVFRSPPHAMVLTSLVGAGSQIAVTMILSVFLCAIHVVDSTHRGTFLSTVIALFLIAHVVSGFVVARLLKLMGTPSRSSAILCVVAFPVALGGGVMTLNMIHWVKGSSAAIPFLTVLGLTLAWVTISLPFAGVGILWGLHGETPAVVTKVSSIPRLIPEEASNMSLYYVLAGSVVPFIACCVEVSFALSAFWREEPMILYGFITFFSITLVALSAEVGIVVTYFTLRGEDYRWWWRSYVALAASGLYVFLYSSLFLKRSLQIRALSSIILFLGYMMGVSAMFGMALGAVGFLGSLCLVMKMYSSIKAD